MRFLLTGGTLNPLKDEYLAALTGYGHTGAVAYPGDPRPCAHDYDALLLPGGGDIDPARFFLAPLENRSETFDIPRDEFEFTLFDRFFTLKKPILGICRGMQLINVALGGTLWQDLPSQCGLTHTAAKDAEPMAHTVVFDNGAVRTVNSFHHQAVRKVARGLSVTARSGDGMAEALKHDVLPVRAVQWHPEKGCFGLEYLLENL